MTERGRARVALLGLTAIWGSTFVVVQSALDHVSPLVMIATRFAVAGLVLAAIQPPAVRAALRALRPALPLSLSMLVGFALQTIGLQTTTPARSAFLTSLSVVFVPFLGLALVRRLPRPALLVAVAAATAGVLTLFWPLGTEWGGGDTLTLIAAVSFGLYIVELERLTRAHSPLAVVIAQCLAIPPLAALAGAALETPRFSPTPGLLAELAYLTLVCTALTFWLMSWAQARVEATEAAVLYTLEPVIAAAFSVALGREGLTLKLAAGGALILAATLISGTGAPPAPEGPLGSRLPERS